MKAIVQLKKKKKERKPGTGITEMFEKVGHVMSDVKLQMSTKAERDFKFSDLILGVTLPSKLLEMT